MEMTRRNIGAAAVVLLAMTFRCRPGDAGQYHGSGTLLCSQCHTMHAEGATARDKLLKDAPTALCTGCHASAGDGSVPDVVTPVANDYTPDEHSGAGFFANTGGSSSDVAHDLDVNGAVPLGSGSMTLTCTTCHAPHGTTNYRNLISNPDGGAGSTTVVEDTDVWTSADPAIPATTLGTEAAYKESNIGYVSNMSKWCAECHTDVASNLAGTPPAHFKRHPSGVDATNTQITAGNHTDPTHWDSGSGQGFGDGVTDDTGGTEGIPRLRFQVFGAGSYAAATNPASGSGTVRVFCGTCHLAHGSKYDSNLAWPHKTVASTDMYSGCQQCHFK